MERARRIFIVSGAEYFFPPPVEKGIADGFKSYAVSFILQDKYKTLNDKQIESAMSKIPKALETQLGALCRSRLWSRVLRHRPKEAGR